jgi:predicted peptidase
VDDGWNTYPPGQYEFTADLTVTEKAVYPTMPPQAEAGQHVYASKDAGLDFLLYVPKGYGDDPGTKWPMLVYLHDAEVRGTNPDFVRRDTLPRRLDMQADLPLLVVSPAGDGDWDFWSKDEMLVPLFSLLDEVQSTYSVDAKRIYLTGAGMGGNGVWAAGLRKPDYFAALAPFDGYLYPFGVPDNICDLKDVPVWALHGGMDFMVPPKVEQDLVDALNACGGTAQITIKPDAVIPFNEYNGSQLYDWLLSQSRK